MNTKDWYIVDAKKAVLGRLASKVASVLSGKHKPSYLPYVDNGDYIIVVNAESIRVTGNKLEGKKYHKHTGYIGNLKTTNLGDMLKKDPSFVIKNAVKGMLPKNSLGRNMIKKLKIYNKEDHSHHAQKPKILEI
ncbi:MAG: 50S ribosomal protein L13 [Pseudomonadota bacterium]|nr:50S ribosomal protein L13 [Pseudomonadota bacterium]MEC8996038.1 50S ribosomal protein L13 [Pseudomonadota bacterium]MED5274504.1 50S ribosomal protein L13 [Pseudomonadota bacterium]MED5430487.1 50S ribosomal protein L13 [Pseudomonadota bacterium]|tara:strand:- start:883 stop:1284 length:402 start_codon:yes stop_codon:yes gene_type:complete